MPFRIRSITPLIMHACLLLAYLFFAYDFSFFASIFSPQHPAASDTVTIVQPTEIGDIDPYDDDNSDRAIGGLIYEPLLRRDSAGVLQPALATNWQVRDDDRITVELRPGATFSSGKPVNCEDISASIVRAGFENITAISRAPGICTLAQPVGTYLLDILTSVAITPAESTSNTSPLGTGPYQLTKQMADVHTFTTNEHHSAVASAPRMLTLITEPDSHARARLLRGQTASVLLDDPSVKAKDLKGYHTSTTLGQTAFFTLMDTQRLSPDQRASIAHAFRQVDLSFDPTLHPLAQLIPASIVGQFQTADAVSIAPHTEMDIELSLATTEANAPLAAQLQRTAANADIHMTIKTIADTQLATEEALTSGTFDVVLLGWDFGRGATNDFLAHILHSPSITRGLLNGFGYRSSDTDRLIDAILAESQDEKRRGLLQELLPRLIEPDRGGTPIAGVSYSTIIREGLPFVREPDGTLRVIETDAD